MNVIASEIAFKGSWGFSLLLLVACLSAGCGSEASNSDISCGKGTELVDGACVPSTEQVKCGEGTELVDGTCIPDAESVVCGEGTELVDGTCIPDAESVECGEGTELVDGTCLRRCGGDEERIGELCFLKCDEAGSPFGGGDGSEVDPYRICSPWHFPAIDSHLDAHFVLTRDLDLSGVPNFKPIGGSTEGSGFVGRFDGAGRTIRELTLKRPGEGDVGLFRRLEVGGRILNLVLEDLDVKGDRTVGALVGRMVGGTVGAVRITAVVEATDGSAGGVVGSISASSENPASLQSVVANVSVKGKSNSGGLVGFVRHAVIDASHFQGSVVTLSPHTGGLAGNAGNITVSASSVTGTIEGRGNSIGGLLGGCADGEIMNSHFQGQVQGSNAVGGLVGHATRCEISGAFAKGSVEADRMVGGLVGYSNASTIARSYATAGVSAENDIAGGAVGEIQEGSIVATYALGPVIATEQADALVGSLKDASVNASYFLMGEGHAPGAWGQPLTRAQFSDESSYTAAWDFSRVWRMQDFEEPDFRRPTLRENPETE